MTQKSVEEKCLSIILSAGRFFGCFPAQNSSSSSKKFYFKHFSLINIYALSLLVFISLTYFDFTMSNARTRTAGMHVSDAIIRYATIIFDCTDIILRLVSIRLCSKNIQIIKILDSVKCTLQADYFKTTKKYGAGLFWLAHCIILIDAIRRFWFTGNHFYTFVITGSASPLKSWLFFDNNVGILLGLAIFDFCSLVAAGFALNMTILVGLILGRRFQSLSEDFQEIFIHNSLHCVGLGSDVIPDPEKMVVTEVRDRAPCALLSKVMKSSRNVMRPDFRMYLNQFLDLKMALIEFNGSGGTYAFFLLLQNSIIFTSYGYSCYNMVATGTADISMLKPASGFIVSALFMFILPHLGNTLSWKVRFNVNSVSLYKHSSRCYDFNSQINQSKQRIRDAFLKDRITIGRHSDKYNQMVISRF